MPVERFRPSRASILYSLCGLRGHFNSIPTSKILDRSKLKAFADKKIHVNQILKIVLGRIENIAGKGENAGHQHFLLFQQFFQKATYSGSIKVEIVW